MLYEIYADELLKVHTSYYIEAESEEEAIKKFKLGLEIGYFADTPMGDIYDLELINYEIYEN